MASPNTAHSKGYVFAAALILLLALAVMILKPFLIALLAAFTLAYIFRPVYSFLLKRIGNTWITALLVSFVILLVLLVPLYFVLNSLAGAIQSVGLAKDFFTGGALQKLCEGRTHFLCTTLDYAKNPTIASYINIGFSKITDYLFSLTTAFLFSIPKVVLTVFVTFYLTFFFLKDGKQIVKKCTGFLPVKPHHQARILKKLNDLMFAVIYGGFIVAVIQAILAGIGFFLFGFENILALTMLTAVASLIPFVGPPLIWVPVVIYRIIQASIIGDFTAISLSIGMAVYASLIVGTIDNVLKPKIIGDKAGVHPVVILLGVLGGITVFGLVGLIIGPVILAILVMFLEILREEWKA